MEEMLQLPQTAYLLCFLLVIFLNQSQVHSLHIRPQPCQNSMGDSGTCMFVWECIKSEGKHLGTCADGFLIGSCCAHSDIKNDVRPPTNVPTTQSHKKPTSTPPSSSAIYSPSSDFSHRTNTPHFQSSSTTFKSVYNQNQYFPTLKPVYIKSTSTQPVTTLRPIHSGESNYYPQYTKPPHSKPSPVSYQPIYTRTTSKPPSTFKPVYVEPLFTYSSIILTNTSSKPPPLSATSKPITIIRTTSKPASTTLKPSNNGPTKNLSSTHLTTPYNRPPFMTPSVTPNQFSTTSKHVYHRPTSEPFSTSSKPEYFRPHSKPISTTLKPVYTRPTLKPANTTLTQTYIPSTSIQHTISKPILRPTFKPSSTTSKPVLILRPTFKPSSTISKPILILRPTFKPSSTTSNQTLRPVFKPSSSATRPVYIKPITKPTKNSYNIFRPTSSTLRPAFSRPTPKPSTGVVSTSVAPKPAYAGSNISTGKPTSVVKPTMNPFYGSTSSEHGYTSLPTQWKNATSFVSWYSTVAQPNFIPKTSTTHQPSLSYWTFKHPYFRPSWKPTLRPTFTNSSTPNPFIYTYSTNNYATRPSFTPFTRPASTPLSTQRPVILNATRPSFTPVTTKKYRPTSPPLSTQRPVISNATRPSFTPFTTNKHHPTSPPFSTKRPVISNATRPSFTQSTTNKHRPTSPPLSTQRPVISNATRPSFTQSTTNKHRPTSPHLSTQRPVISNATRPSFTPFTTHKYRPTSPPISTQRPVISNATRPSFTQSTTNKHHPTSPYFSTQRPVISNATRPSFTPFTTHKHRPTSPPLSTQRPVISNATRPSFTQSTTNNHRPTSPHLSTQRPVISNATRPSFTQSTTNKHRPTSPPLSTQRPVISNATRPYFTQSTTTKHRPTSPPLSTQRPIILNATSSTTDKNTNYSSTTVMTTSSNSTHEPVRNITFDDHLTTVRPLTTSPKQPLFPTFVPVHSQFTSIKPIFQNKNTTSVTVFTSSSLTSQSTFSIKETMTPSISQGSTEQLISVTVALHEETEETLEVAMSKVTTTTTPLPVTPCGIPLSYHQKKVVGGKNSAFGSWPWQLIRMQAYQFHGILLKYQAETPFTFEQASVRRTSFFGFSSTHRCGGALISRQWVATAGHCVDDLVLSQIKIRVGEYDFASSQEPYEYLEQGIRKKIVHPRYNFFTYENDLALVQLEEAIDTVKYPHISPICLPPYDRNLIGQNATVTGWGRLTEGGVLPSILQEVVVPIISNEKCKNMFLAAGRHEYIPDIFMCAGFEEGGRDSCQGDSGGPLQLQSEEGYWFLAGIISWGIGCAEPNMPGVCTRISKFKEWVVQNIN